MKNLFLPFLIPAVALAPTCQAQTYNVVHNFTGQSDGAASWSRRYSSRRLIPILGKCRYLRTLGWSYFSWR